MLSVTLDLPDELAHRLRPLTQQLPRILELGLREWNAEAQVAYEGTAQVIEFLAGLPSPEEILALRPSDEFQARAAGLLQKRKDGELPPAEEAEWQHYQYLEHLVRLAKIQARLKLPPP